MSINNVSVQHNVGFLPDMILLTQCYDHRGTTRFNAMKRFFVFICSLWSHLNVLTFSPLTGGCSKGLDAFRFFFKQQINGSARHCGSRVYIYIEQNWRLGPRSFAFVGSVGQQK